MTRIKSDNVQIGSSYVLSIENQHKEELSAIEKMMIRAKAEKERLIKEGTEEAKKLVDEAKQILAQAQEDGKNIIEQANKQADSESGEIRENARKEGYDDGYKQGYDDGTKSLEEKVIAVETFTKSQFDLKNNIVKSAELDIIELVCAIARKVCKRAFDEDINVLKAITIEAINKLKDKEQITITVNPDVAAKIYSISEELKQEIPKLESIKILEDSNVSEDGTIVESMLSRVDSRLKIQIDQIVEKLYTAHYSSDEIENNETYNEIIFQNDATMEQAEEIAETNIETNTNIDFETELENKSEIEE
ncbi:hypothetical protein IKE67_07230 [bacterium]|nr:hypothetical protein [bacterium]